MEKNEGINKILRINLKKICPVCGTSLEQIIGTIKTGTDSGIPKTSVPIIKKIGCAECYNTFEDEFSILYKVSAEYKGSLPKRLKGYRSVLTDRMDLRVKLDAAVEHEEYEKAALYRDYLKILEKKQQFSPEMLSDSEVPDSTTDKNTHTDKNT